MDSVLHNTSMLRNTGIQYAVDMTKEQVEVPKTDNMNVADMRAQIVRVLGARVQYAKEHVRVWRYKEAQAVIVPEDWYERACEALGETGRVNLVRPQGSSAS